MPMSFLVDIRPLAAAEHNSVEEFLLKLDPRSRRERFFGPASDASIAQHVMTALKGGGVFFGAFVGGRLRGIAELHSHLADVAEAAFVVEPSFRNRGIGTKLLRSVLKAATTRGFRSVRIACLPANAPMRRLACKCRATLHASFDQLTGEIACPPVRSRAYS
jgi:RimJ/RimL family protein N-acetyltransferase